MMSSEYTNSSERGKPKSPSNAHRSLGSLIRQQTSPEPNKLQKEENLLTIYLPHMASLSLSKSPNRNGISNTMLIESELRRLRDEKAQLKQRIQQLERQVVKLGSKLLKYLEDVDIEDVFRETDREIAVEMRQPSPVSPFEQRPLNSIKTIEEAKEEISFLRKKTSQFREQLTESNRLLNMKLETFRSPQQKRSPPIRALEPVHEKLGSKEEQEYKKKISYLKKQLDGRKKSIKSLKARAQKLEDKLHRVKLTETAEQQYNEEFAKHKDLIDFIEQEKKSGEVVFDQHQVILAPPPAQYDIWENDKEYVVVLDAPGIPAEDVHISLGYDEVKISYETGLFESTHFMKKFKSHELRRLHKDDLNKIIKHVVQLPTPIDVTSKNVYGYHGSLYITVEKLEEEEEEAEEEEEPDNNRKKGRNERDLDQMTSELAFDND